MRVQASPRGARESRLQRTSLLELAADPGVSQFQKAILPTRRRRVWVAILCIIAPINVTYYPLWLASMD